MMCNGLVAWLGLSPDLFTNEGFSAGCIFAVLLTGSFAAFTLRRFRLQAAETKRERILRLELEAYTRLDPTILQGSTPGTDLVQARKALAIRVCRTVAEKSAFTRVMMLMRDAERHLPCIASIGVDDLTVSALVRWGEQVVAEERGHYTDPEAPRRSGPRTAGKPVGNQSGMPRAGDLLGRGGASFSIQLGGWNEFDREVDSWKMAGRAERRKWRRAIVVPIRIRATSDVRQGSLVGAIVVCTDGLAPLTGRNGAGKERLDRLLGPLEMLASRLGQAAEYESLVDRLLQAEKLIGIGQLAGGVAHALNNPLAAVLGYAELIAETSHDPRTRSDASTIVAEALKMRATVQQITSFSQQSPLPALFSETVDLLGLVHSLEQRHALALSERGIQLHVDAPSSVSVLRGSSERLNQVLDQLISNSSRAIAAARPREEGEHHSIRISLSEDEHALHLIVSDTGTGFADPGRAFDPFYTTSEHPSEGSGLGLSLCFGIVREHAGKISASNLHPHGAAVTIELPLHAPAAESGSAPAKKLRERNLTTLKAG